MAVRERPRTGKTGIPTRHEENVYTEVYRAFPVHEKGPALLRFNEYGSEGVGRLGCQTTQGTGVTDTGKTIYVFAGPNGAGKTTFARQYLPVEAKCLTFINADLIAAGLAPFDPERAALRAGRLMLELIDQHVQRGESFAFETTLAAKSFASSIPAWRGTGYTVVIYFLALPTVERALDRVARRVYQGGHAVADDVVRRRFIAGRQNFEQIYKALVDQWVLLDNSGPEPIIIESGGRS